MTMIKRVGVLTGGGDCPGLNAVLRAVGKYCISHDVEVLGFRDGFRGVMENDFCKLDNKSLSGIVAEGGTILGTSNIDNPFSWASRKDLARGLPQSDQSDIVLQRMAEHRLDGLIVIGGDGSLNIAHRLNSEKGVPCIGVPKTIDNDLDGTDVTFGFDTAVQIATEAIDRLHTTAMSHHRAMVVEVMGRYAGWIALHAGVAGGADVILIPEIPFSVEAVNRRISERSTRGSRYSIIVVAEGAKAIGGEMVVARTVAGSHDAIRLGGIGARLAQQIEAGTGVESRATVLGHLQRGGPPSSRDRLLGTQFGYLAGELAVNGRWGMMAAAKGAGFTAVSLQTAVGKLKLVNPDDPLIAAARAVGTCFGDEA
jgi:6-phosphofructokinase 1